MNEVIIIKGLQVLARVGVPDKERSKPQNLLVDLTITPATGFAAMEDQLERSIDYQAVSGRVMALAAERPRKLIETLASDIAETVLKEFGARAILVEVRKFILPDTEYVAVSCERRK